MITFNENDEFIITAKGDKGEYLATMRAILRLIATQDENAQNRNEVYYAISLLQDMLPTEEELEKLCEK